MPLKTLFTATIPALLLFTATPASALSLYNNDWQLQQDLQGIEWELNDLNRSLRQQRSTDTFRRLSEARQQILEKFRSMGIEAFYATNEGKIRAGLEKEPVCPANAHGILDYCACDEGYSYDAFSFSCVDTNQLIKVTEDMLNGLTDEIEGEMRKSGQGTKAVCTMIEGAFDVLDKSYNVAADKLQNVAQAYVPAIKTSLQMIADYSKELESLYNEQCVQRSTANTTTKKITNTSIMLPPDITTGTWYSNALSTFIDAGWISGQQSFRPAELATREEVIRLIVQMNGGVLHELPSQPSFDDVPVDSTAFGWFEEAAKEGWVTGQGDCYGKHPCKAKPNDPINRAEAAALIIRAFALTQGEAPAFDDAPAGAWYGDIIRTAASHCILQGDSGARRVRPAANMNRAEMIAMLWRVDQGLTYPNCQ